MRGAAWAAGVLAAVLVAPLAAHEGHEHATGIVKERMDAMESMAKRMKAINERIKDKRELAAIKADAEAIASLASHVTHQFPPGSNQRPTQARPAIWQNWVDFERKARALEAASAKLVSTGGDDVKALDAAARGVSQACAACHEKYRTKRR
jgi:cytochrome c556